MTMSVRTLFITMRKASVSDVLQIALYMVVINYNVS